MWTIKLKDLVVTSREYSRHVVSSDDVTSHGDTLLFCFLSGRQRNLCLSKCVKSCGRLPIMLFSILIVASRIWLSSCWQAQQVQMSPFHSSVTLILFWLNPQNGLCLLCSKSPVYGFCRTMLRAANFFTKTVLIHCCIKAQHRRQKKCPIGVSIESPPVQWHFLFLQSHRGKAALYQTNLQWMHSIMNRNDATKQPTKLWPRFSHTGAAPFAAYGRIITSTTKKPNA